VRDEHYEGFRRQPPQARPPEALVFVMARQREFNHLLTLAFSPSVQRSFRLGGAYCFEGIGCADVSRVSSKSGVRALTARGSPVTPSSIAAWPTLSASLNSNAFIR
jgi:hypothetical protein